MYSSWQEHGIVLKLLDEFYCFKSTLKVFLQCVFEHYGVDREKMNSLLETEEEEVQDLLSNTIATCHCNAEVVPKKMSLFSVAFEMKDIIYYVVSKRCKRHEEEDFVLSLGSALCKKESIGIMTYPHGIEQYYPNSTAAILLFPCWEMLLSLIGSDLVIFILDNLTLFSKLPNGNVLQINGKLVEKLKKLNDHVCASSSFAEINPFLLVESASRCLQVNDGKISADLKKLISKKRTLKRKRPNDEARGKRPKTAYSIKKATFAVRSLMYDFATVRKINKNLVCEETRVLKRDAKLLAVKVCSVRPYSSKLNRCLSIVGELMKRYRKVKVGHILDKYCPMSTELKKLQKAFFCQQKWKKGEGFDKKQLLIYKRAVADNVMPFKVFLFTKEVCRRVLPKGLLGTQSNWQKFFKNLKNFFTLKKSEVVTLLQLMQGIKCSKVSWTYPFGKRPNNVPKSFSLWQTKIVQNVIFWIVKKFVMPLVKACFYITETGMHRGKLLFYRKSTWRVIDSLGKNSLTANFLKVKRDVAKMATSEQGQLYKIRLIPKSRKARPIVLGVKKKGRTKKVPHSTELNRLHTVLKLLQQQQPNLIGSAVTELDELNTKLIDFHQKSQENGLGSKFYFVSSDIDRCFDSVPHDKLLEVVGNAMQNCEYYIRRFHTISSIVNKQVKVRTRYAASDDTRCELFPDFIKKHVVAKGCRISNSIVTDAVFNVWVDKDSLRSLLETHLKKSYAHLGGSWYRRIRGIPQGSVLSTMLCNILYGDMENSFLQQFLQAENCLLVRWTDDFFLVTTSENVAKNFLKTLIVGFPEYGCFVNVSKTKTNITCDLGDAGKDIKRDTGLWYPWCHLLLNVHSLEVRYSYDRYIGESINDSITFRLDSSAGSRLFARMKQIVRTRLTAIVLDPMLNSQSNILVNIYNIFCFTIKKLANYICKLPKNGQPNVNPVFFMRVIQGIFKAFYKQYLRIQLKICSNRTALVAKKMARRLYYAAVFRILQRKPSRYNRLFRLLRPHPTPEEKAIINRGIDSEAFIYMK